MFLSSREEEEEEEEARDKSGWSIPDEEKRRTYCFFFFLYPCIWQVFRLTRSTSWWSDSAPAVPGWSPSTLKANWSTPLLSSSTWRWLEEFWTEIDLRWWRLYLTKTDPLFSCIKTSSLYLHGGGSTFTEPPCCSATVPQSERGQWGCK